MIGYVAKDKNGKVYIYSEEPTYDNELEFWISSNDMFEITNQFPEFDNISYKDEPIKVEIKLERV